MPRKSRRPVQRGDPTLDRRTWVPPTGRVARAATASEASATARKIPKKAKEPKIGLLQLLHFATPLDYICLSIAVPCAAWTGFLQVSILFIFGALLDSLGSTSATGVLVPETFSLGSWEMPLWFWFVFLGLGQWILCTVYNGLTDTAKERMIVRYKLAYVKAILRQDIGWYDTNNPLQLSTRIGEGLKTIEEALSPKAVILFEWLAMAVTGWALCFKYEWRVALVILACSPLVLLGGALMGYAQLNGQKSVVDGYAEAGAIATEVLGAVRTVASLGLETLSASRYDAALHKAQRAGIKVSLLVGLGMAILFSAPNVMMGAGLMYGTSLLKDVRTERQMQHSFLVRTAGGFNTTLQLCAKPCDEYNMANVDYNTTRALYKHNTLLPATPRSCADFGAKVLTWTCFTADLTVSSGLFDADAWAALSFSSSDSSPLTFLEVPGQPALLDDASFRSYFEQQTGGWTCSVLPAAVLLAIFALQNGAQGLGNVGQPVNIIAKGRQAGVAILQTIRRVPAIDSFSTAGATLDSVTGAIEVVDVVFAYPSAPERTICHGYSLSIGAGQTVALCGPSGSGKSTLVALLERFYDPQGGAITLDGVDIRTLNLRWLRSQLGLVGQEPVLFEGTVAENIGYGKEGASQDEIEEAARAANAHGFVMDSLPDGYATQVGQGGGMLSGGQKQRVAIARAIVRKPAVLLLDEATSALDTAGERVVQAALDSIVSQHKRTTVTIAHRLSTIKNADKIAVLQDGAVVEEGTYQELLDLGEGGAFFKLAQAQEKTEGGRLPSVGSGMDLASLAEVTLRSVTAEATGAGSGWSGGKAESGKQRRKGKGGKDAPPKNVIRRLLSMQNKGDAWYLFAGALGTLLVSAFWPSIGVLFAELLTTPFTPNPDEVARQGVFWGGLFMISFPLCLVCSVLQSGGLGVAGEHLTRNLRSHSVSKWLTMEIAFFDEEANSSGELTQFLGESVTLIQALSGEKLGQLLQLSFTLVVGLSLMFALGDWAVSLVVLGALPLMGVAMTLQVTLVAGGKVGDAKTEGTGRRAAASRSAGALISEVVLGIRTVASFTAEHKLFADYSAIVQSASRQALCRNWAIAFATGFAKGLIIMIFGAIFEFGMWRVRMSDAALPGAPEASSDPDECAGSLDLSGSDAIFIPLMVMFLMAASIGGSASQATDASKASAAAAAYFKRVDRPSLLDPTSDEGGTLPGVTGAIEVVDVVFAYPTRPDFTICHGYSLSIGAGQTVALCGPSGSGKSTLIALLERFYDPQGGAITLDGVDIRTLNLRWLRSQLGLVGQEPVLFEGTVAENIGYGKEGASQDEIEEAARAANAHGFVMDSLPDGYSTQVGLRGGMLSGGQKQRVAIARAIVRKPAVLLLDEATSALDNESERVVQAALDSIVSQHKRTTVTIAHRLSTIKNADKIAVLRKGAVIEQGTHEELLELGGTYLALWEAQQ